jgi:alpha-amylase/alpha-mannosidase (GH57 family)/carbohydrate-binding DOMON domain-containing protein
MKKISLILILAFIFAGHSFADKLLFKLADPVGDDHGPGSYVYPTNPVFNAGSFDLTGFEVYENDNDIIFKVYFRNWFQSPPDLQISNNKNLKDLFKTNLFLQNLDIYIDKDHKYNSGITVTLPGRNVKISPESAWEQAVFIAPQPFLARAETKRLASETADNIIIPTNYEVNQNFVQFNIPKKILGQPTEKWGYLILVTGAEWETSMFSLSNWMNYGSSYEEPDLNRIVDRYPSEWEFGGGDPSGAAPNIIDLLVSKGESQEKMLGAYDPQTKKRAVLSAAYQAEEPLYLSLVWHQHQPLYYKDPSTGLYQAPWVRMHCAKDYYDMAALLEKYPAVRATFNLTPTLVRQIDDLVSGARDKAFVLSEKPADGLTTEDKKFILKRFFDANWNTVIPKYPRYAGLLKQRGADSSDSAIEDALNRFTDQDFLDLQVWFNLAWLDPDFQAEPEIAALLKKGRNFTEQDKRKVLDQHLEIIKMVIPEHVKLQNSGQAEITMTPYTHPILPLIYDSDLAKVCMPYAPLPSRFSYPSDAVAQVKKGVEFYRAHFGKEPAGMWPGEGAVAQEIVEIVAGEGLKWMATDEEILEKSLGIQLQKDTAGRLLNPEILYKPYVVEQNGKSLAILFRDKVVSDKIAFTYSGLSGEAAAKDILDRLRFVKSELDKVGGGPYLFSLILDGENPWEYYSDDGKSFLNALYSGLSTDADFQTITPSEFTKKFPPKDKIDNLWPGSWVNHNFDTWIGKPEKNKAWEALLSARRAVEGADPKRAEAAMEAIYAAEGSDWFWWYDRGVEEVSIFDQMYRNTLASVYQALDLAVPPEIQVPLLVEKKAVPLAEELKGAKIILDVKDPIGDDHGPGPYVYPINDIFPKRGFDLERFMVAADEKDVIFVFKVGALPNPWNSPIGLSLQTVDVYIDKDHQPNSGSTVLLPGRQAATEPSAAWEYAVWVEGWLQELHQSDPKGKLTRIDGAVRATTNEQERTITIRVPKEILGDDPQHWGYIPVLLGQEGYPPPGNWRIRPVEKEAKFWRFGGGPDDFLTHPFIIDMIAPKGLSQEKILSKYITQETTDYLKIDPKNFCKVPEIRVR